LELVADLCERRSLLVRRSAPEMSVLTNATAGLNRSVKTLGNTSKICNDRPRVNIQQNVSQDIYVAARSDGESGKVREGRTVDGREEEQNENGFESNQLDDKEAKATPS
jgi:hypothetical protein